MTSDDDYLTRAIALAYENVARGGRPFGALVVSEGRVIATGVNETLQSGDPTAHAELEAIRAASKSLGPRLDGCTVYASGQPCPMCLSAMYLTGVSALGYAYSNDEGEPYGLSTAHVYAEVAKPLADQTLSIAHRPVRVAAHDPYEAWRAHSEDGRH